MTWRDVQCRWSSVTTRKSSRTVWSWESIRRRRQWRSSVARVARWTSSSSASSTVNLSLSLSFNHVHSSSTRRHHVVGWDRCVTPEWRRRTARLHRSPAGRLLSERIWSSHLLLRRLGDVSKNDQEDLQDKKDFDLVLKSLMCWGVLPKPVYVTYW